MEHKVKNFHFEKMKKYFEKDYIYKAILHKINKKYNLSISLRTLTRLLNKNNFKRKNFAESPKVEILIAIMIELEGSGANLDYKAMCKRQRNVYKLKVKQKTVMKILQEVDPDGVERRSKYKLKRRTYLVPGPNYIWHADGHDKLKWFGFAIQGCIDGYSRKLIWLKISTTNNDLRVIGYYYLKCIEKLGLLPTLMRTDNGTEATLMQDFHMSLRFNHTDEYARIKSLRGKSTSNQRIESYWRQLRKNTEDFYMSLFKKMEHENILNIENAIHIDYL